MEQHRPSQNHSQRTSLPSPQQNQHPMQLQDLMKENEELKAINWQWDEFWSVEKRRQDQENAERDRQLADLRNQLSMANRSLQQLQQQQQQQQLSSSLANNPTESLIADTSEAVRRLERERARLDNELLRVNRELDGLRQENEALRAQATQYREDFERERQSGQVHVAELREQLSRARSSDAGGGRPPQPPRPAVVGPPVGANRRFFPSGIYDVLPDSVHGPPERRQ